DVWARTGFSKLDLRDRHSCHTGTVGQRLLRHSSPEPRFPKRQHSTSSLPLPNGNPGVRGTGCQAAKSAIRLFPELTVNLMPMVRVGVRSAFRLGRMDLSRVVEYDDVLICMYVHDVPVRFRSKACP